MAKPPDLRLMVTSVSVTGTMSPGREPSLTEINVSVIVPKPNHGVVRGWRALIGKEVKVVPSGSDSR